MSVSEKLKALDEEKTFNPMHLWNALPQIVAVVGAAEALVAAVDQSIDAGLRPSLSGATAERVRLDELVRPALVALDEELS